MVANHLASTATQKAFGGRWPLDVRSSAHQPSEGWTKEKRSSRCRRDSIWTGPIPLFKHSRARADSPDASRMEVDTEEVERFLKARPGASSAL